MMRFLKKWKNQTFDFNEFHLKVLKNQSKNIEASQHYLKKNKQSIAPIHLAQYLHRKECLDKLDYSFEYNFQVEENGKRLNLDLQEFEKKFGIEYLPYLQFDKWSTFKNVHKKSKKAAFKHYISTDQKWLGAYYSHEITIGYIPNLIIKWLGPRKGYGVFAGKDIKENQFIGEYSGIVRKRTPRKDWKNAYCFEYLIADKWPVYLTIDAKNQGNLIRFINHSDTPNLKPFSIYANGIMHVILLASTPISKGAELTYDYGPGYWKKRENPI